MTEQDFVFAFYLLIISGFGCLLFGGIAMWKVISFQNWGLIPGKVLSSWVEKERVYRGKRYYYIYHAIVDYSYVVDEKLYTSRRLQLVGEQNTDKYSANQLVRRYSKGKTINVYVNPNDPHQATLKLGYPIFPVMLLILGVILTVGGITLAVLQAFA